MKIKFLVVILLISVMGLYAVNEKNLYGVWEIVEFTIVQKGNTSKSDEKTLRDAGAIWNMYFSEDGTFKQEFNMRNPQNPMEIENGIWSTGKDSLFVEIQIDTISRKLDYYCVVLGDAVVLTLQHPTSPDKVVTKFRKKR